MNFSDFFQNIQKQIQTLDVFEIKNSILTRFLKRAPKKPPNDPQNSTFPKYVFKKIVNTSGKNSNKRGVWRFLKCN